MTSEATRSIRRRLALGATCALGTLSTTPCLAAEVPSLRSVEAQSAPIEPQTADATLRSEWGPRDGVFRLDELLGRCVPSNYQPGSFSYTEVAYDRPARERRWWWAKMVGVTVISGVAVYASAGLLVPYVGGTIGAWTGLSGAAAVSHGLALLGGGALSAGGFGMAGGTAVVLVVTDLALSTSLDYALDVANRDDRLSQFTRAIERLRENSDDPGRWEDLIVAANQAATRHPTLYPVIAHAVGMTYLQLIGLEGIQSKISTGTSAGDQSDATADPRVDKHRVLLTGALRMLARAESLEPQSSVVTHATANAYWWASVRGGCQVPENAPSFFTLGSDRTSDGSLDDAASYELALQYFQKGALYEPRNARNWSDWASALEADASIYEGIAVMAAASNQLQLCNAEDQITILRKAAALQHQADDRVYDAENDERSDSQEARPLSSRLQAAFQGYSRAWRLDPKDWLTTLSLANLHRQHALTGVGANSGIASRLEVQIAVSESALEIAKALAKDAEETSGGSPSPLEFATVHEELLAWAFEGLVAPDSTDDVAKRAYVLANGWIELALQESSSDIPYRLDQLMRLRARIDQYNRECTFPWNELPLKALDQARVRLEEGVSQ